MLPTARNPSPSSNAETVLLLALLGALAVPVIAVVQVWSDGSAATVERAAWWLRIGLGEAGFVLVLATAAIVMRRRRA